MSFFTLLFSPAIVVSVGFLSLRALSPSPTAVPTHWEWLGPLWTPPPPPLPLVSPPPRGPFNFLTFRLFPVAFWGPVAPNQGGRIRVAFSPTAPFLLLRSIDSVTRGQSALQLFRAPFFVLRTPPDGCLWILFSGSFILFYLADCERSRKC